MEFPIYYEINFSVFFFLIYFSFSVKVKVEGGKVYVTTDNKVSLIPLWFYFMVQYKISCFFILFFFFFFFAPLRNWRSVLRKWAVESLESVTRLFWLEEVRNRYIIKPLSIKFLFHARIPFTSSLDVYHPLGVLWCTAWGQQIHKNMF